MKKVSLKILFTKPIEIEVSTKKTIIKDFLVEVLSNNIVIENNKIVSLFGIINKRNMYWILLDQYKNILNINNELTDSLLLCCINIRSLLGNYDVSDDVKEIIRNYIRDIPIVLLNDEKKEVINAIEKEIVPLKIKIEKKVEVPKKIHLIVKQKEDQNQLIVLSDRKESKKRVKIVLDEKEKINQIKNISSFFDKPLNKKKNDNENNTTKDKEKKEQVKKDDTLNVINKSKDLIDKKEENNKIVGKVVSEDNEIVDSKPIILEPDLINDEVIIEEEQKDEIVDYLLENVIISSDDEKEIIDYKPKETFNNDIDKGELREELVEDVSDYFDDSVENVDDKDLDKKDFNEDKKEEKKEDSKEKDKKQKIGYTVLSPKGGVLYHKEITNYQPLTVEALLIQSGLKINNSLGFIESIEGIKNEGMSGWVFEVNDMPVMVSASEYVINPEDQITWKYVDFSKVDEKSSEKESIVSPKPKNNKEYKKIKL